jgi:hypothetical protein
MEVHFDIIHGLSFGIEYIAPSEEADIACPCVVLDVAMFRWVFEFTS